MQRILLVTACTLFLYPSQSHGDQLEAGKVKIFLDTSGSMDNELGSNKDALYPNRRIDYVVPLLTSIFMNWPVPTASPRLVFWSEETEVLPYNNPHALANYLSTTEINPEKKTKLGLSLEQEANETCVHHQVITDEYPDDKELYARELERILMHDSLSIFVLETAYSESVAEKYLSHSQDNWPQYSVHIFDGETGAELLSRDIEMWYTTYCNVGL